MGVVKEVPNLQDPYHTLGLIHEALHEPRRALDFYMIAAHLAPKVRRLRGWWWWSGVRWGLRLLVWLGHAPDVGLLLGGEDTSCLCGCVSGWAMVLTQRPLV
jgi:hypothetical protein